MTPPLAAALLFSAAAIWMHQAAAVAVQDLDLRPVALAAFRGSPLPDDEALPLLEAAAARMPGRADALLRLGERLDASGGEAAVARAGALYREAALAFPALGLGQYRLSVALLRAGDEAGANHHMRVAAACAGNHPALLFHLGDWHLELWRRIADPAALLDALDFYRLAAAREPGRLGEIFGRLSTVLTDPADLALVTPPDADSRTTLGLHLSLRGKPEAALAVLDALPAVEGRAREVALARGRSLLQSGRTAEGRAALAAVLAEAPADDLPRLVPGVEGALVPLLPADRAAFWTERPAADPFSALARARALAAAGDPAGAMAAVDGALRLLRPEGAPPAGAAERAALVLCHEMRMKDWIRRKVPNLAAAEAAEAARLDDTPARWRAAARLFVEGGDRAGARGAFGRALRAVPRDGAALRAEIEEERERALVGAGSGGGR